MLHLPSLAVIGEGKFDKSSPAKPVSHWSKIIPITYLCVATSNSQDLSEMVQKRTFKSRGMSLSPLMPKLSGPTSNLRNLAGKLFFTQRGGSESLGRLSDLQQTVMQQITLH
jgi:hypothetical protein